MLIRYKNDLPKSFSIDNYNDFDNLNDVDFYNQLLLRFSIMFMESPDNLNEKIAEELFQGIVTNSKYFVDIFDDKEVFDEEDFHFYERSTRWQRSSLENSMFIHAFLREDLVLKRPNLIKTRSHSLKNRIGNFDPNTLSSIGRYFLSENNCIHGDVYLKINVNHPDEDLLQELLYFLSSWRKTLNIEDPNKNIVIQSWDVVKAKLIKYKAIPLIDLWIWSDITGNRIKNEVLAVTLYPEGEYGSNNIAQTIEPFLDKILSFFSMKKFKKEILEK
ncbi:DUF6387 family protein [Arsenophonus sp. PmNCSU2021_1]|uniref:DUF6387 family protein n=1 Tax=Arsenophonus sp. PmNCSU2021_1 TaxID=3118989 RepID=UPI002FEE82C3